MKTAVLTVSTSVSARRAEDASGPALAARAEHAGCEVVAMEVVPAAAARVGLKFIVFTDHGDATRRPDAPAYRSGVLCLDGVEISTTGGHYIALDMPASPFPLGGEPRDVVEDVQRLGGFGIVAHPDSPKTELRANARNAGCTTRACDPLRELCGSWRTLENSAPSIRFLVTLASS